MEYRYINSYANDIGRFVEVQWKQQYSHPFGWWGGRVTQVNDDDDVDSDDDHDNDDDDDDGDAAATAANGDNDDDR